MGKSSKPLHLYNFTVCKSDAIAKGASDLWYIVKNVSFNSVENLYFHNKPLVQWENFEKVRTFVCYCGNIFWLAAVMLQFSSTLRKILVSDCDSGTQQNITRNMTMRTNQWRREAKCRPRLTIKVPPFLPLKVAYKNLKWNKIMFRAGADPVGVVGAIAPPKTYKRNFIHHNFVQFRK